MNLNMNEDNELALAAQAGDREAFADLVRRNQSLVYRVAFRLTGDREAAFDVSQDVFVKAFGALSKWQPSGSFRAWLVRLTSNASIDHLRRRKRRSPERLVREIERRPKARHWLEGDTNTTDQQVRGQEIEERVREAMSELSPTQEKVFVLRHYEELQLSEIADILGSSEGSIKVHLFRALRKLRPLLIDLYDKENV